MQKILPFGGAAVLCLVLNVIHGQTIDTTLSGGKAAAIPNKVFAVIQRKSMQLDQALQGQTTQYLQNLSQQDARLCSQLAKTDTAAAARLSANSAASYQSWITKISSVSKPGTLVSPSGGIRGGDPIVAI